MTRTTRMTRSRTAHVAVATTILAALGAATMAQEVVVIRPQPQVRVQEVRPQVSRAYRSYSVQPSTELRGSVRHSPRHSGEATWRHADSKAMGNFRTGR